ncbi:coenzyme F420-0:L-glutamate ligase / coenzyme F420-1:gamma-L-glutamate ligase [Nocardioides scoriae]|uniref:Coenzyme F420-0:L-glutamate ligase / coenzyme F420-1:gamma-L-glutamate ligase n=1 Tax=Nocardioides scoriae TaxID=642780 RepID=A0A1H1QWP4_9ACTN|nr:coenzyme F420-0:L-glutamate ligase [Nocardioides scoriae]SDS27894.1 coenzyme F420-0:L-glutamate ligase / coenzyme F420-1:gamma-L-glutamate ligase [Nocardioides scoriae]
MSQGLRAWPVEGIGEVGEGTPLPDLLAGVELDDGDVVVVTSKVVSKAEGRVRRQDRDEAITEETVRVVARRGPTRIVENRLGLVMAAAGVDASNVAADHVVLLPLDPDGSARRLREDLARERGTNVAVVVTDTAGRAWRTGQTDLALGLAGLLPLEDLSGRTDGYGNPLVVTAPAVADEVASLAELVTGKLGGRPVTVVRGLGARVLPAGEHGPGARPLLRPREQDMFALGAREAVVAAVRGREQACFGAPAAPEELVEALASCGIDARATDGPATDGLGTPVVRVDLPHGSGVRDQVVALERARLVAHAHAWGPFSDTGGGPGDGPGDSVWFSPTAP